MLYVQLLLFGLCVGVMSGMLGIGGGIILVPGLILLFGFSQEQAQGTSLAALSTPIFVFAAMVYYQGGHVRIPVAAAVAGGILIGAVIGAVLVPYVPRAGLRIAFGGLLAYLGFLFLFGPYVPRSMSALPVVLASLLTTIAAWVRGKRAPTIPLPPPDERHEYHI